MNSQDHEQNSKNFLIEHQFALEFSRNRFASSRKMCRTSKIFFKSSRNVQNTSQNFSKFPNIPQKQFQSDDSFISAISPVATLVQFLALMPVCGISHANSSALKFKFFSLRVIWTVCYILYGAAVSGYFFTFIYGLGISAQNIGNYQIIRSISRVNFDDSTVGFVFFSYTTICTIVFLFIARIWPELMRVWAEKEQRFLCFPYQTDGIKLSIKIRMTAAVVIIMGFLEHALFVANSVVNQNKFAAKCNWTIEAPLSHFLEKQFGFIFERNPFSLPLGLFVESVNVSFTFGWNYMEIFVMMVSVVPHNFFMK